MARGSWKISVFADAVRGFTSWLPWLYKQKQIKYINQKQKRKEKKREKQNKAKQKKTST